jgi:hypothetical protein
LIFITYDDNDFAKKADFEDFIEILYNRIIKENGRAGITLDSPAVPEYHRIYGIIRKYRANYTFVVKLNPLLAPNHGYS